MIHLDGRWANSLQKRPKSKLFRGLEAKEGLYFMYALVAVFFFSLMIFSWGSFIGFYVAALILPMLLIIKKTLEYFHKREASGFLVSFISYLFYQPKKIYASKCYYSFKKK